MTDGDIEQQLRGIGERIERSNASPSKVSPRKSLARQQAVVLTPMKYPASISRLTVKAETDITPRPLERSMSEEERSHFMDTLSKASGGKHVTVYCLPKDIVPDAERRAHDHGFHTKILTAAKDSSTTKLVLGRDAGAVRAVTDDAGQQEVGKAGSLPVAAGAAIFGAAVTFAGLAYS